MPPIRQLDEVFLSHLLNNDENTHDAILNTNINSTALSSVLKKLSTTSNAFQLDLFEQVHAHFDEFQASYNTSHALHASIFDLVKQVANTSTQVTETQDTVRRSLDEYQDALLASQKNQLKMDTLEKLQDMLQVVEMISQELKQFGYLDAVKHILELTRILEAWKDNGDARVFKLMHDRMAHLKQILISHLQDGIQTAIQYNIGSMRILETFHPNNNNTTTVVHLGDVFQCLDQLGLLAEEMMGIQRQIFKYIFHPYFENRLDHHLQIDHVNIDHVGNGGVLQVIQGETEKKLDPISMSQHMNTILSFFFKYMFNNEKCTTMNLLFGNLLLPELTDKMILKGIAPAIPTSKYNLANFDEVAQSIKEFESQCIYQYGFLLAQTATSDPTSLQLYVDNVDKHYAKKRREKILGEGRKVMVRRLYDAEMTQVEINGHMYRYQITQTPQVLSVLVSDTLTEATELLGSHPISAAILVHGIQDLLDMYRAMMPSYHRRQYLSGPANALIFRNDCLWLANQLISSIAVRSEIGHFGNLIGSLNEATARLEELGQAWYELAMMHRVQMIQHILDGLDGFTGMAENVTFGQECDHAISQVIELVGSFSTETQFVVDETLFLDMLGRIVESILERLIYDIEALVDIGAEESHVIACTLNSLAQLVGSFDCSEVATESFVADLVPSWQKFWLVKDILEMNMRDIMESFRRGDLHMFEKSELVGLLCALFADTELRESNILEIKTGAHHDTTTHISMNLPPVVTVTPSTINALKYTPDDDMEGAADGGGWGDEDDDLFVDQSIATTTIAAPILLEPLLDMEMNDEEGGWGDADEDVFGDDKPETSLTGTIENAKTTTSVQSPLSVSSALNFQANDQEIEDEEGGGGWGWDNDEDLFKDQDLK